MKILFTGANGFLGSHVIPLLRKKSFDVRTLGTQTGDYVYDITKEMPFFDEDFDIIFHAAGKAHSIPSNYEEENEFYDINFEGTKKICKALENKLPKIFIFISSVAVYGIDSGVAITEQTPLNGTTPYAKSKIRAEEFLLQWSEKHGVQLYILRPSLIAGPEPPGNLGDMISAIKKGCYFNIGGGKALKSILWVEDFAEILVKTLDNKGGIYNVCDSRNYSFKEISTMIAKSMNKSTPHNIPFFLAKFFAVIGDVVGKGFPLNSNKLDKITKSLTFSNQKITSELGFAPSDVNKKFMI